MLRRLFSPRRRAASTSSSSSTSSPLADGTGRTTKSSDGSSPIGAVAAPVVDQLNSSQAEVDDVELENTSAAAGAEDVFLVLSTSSRDGGSSAGEPILHIRGEYRHGNDCGESGSATVAVKDDGMGRGSSSGSSSSAHAFAFKSFVNGLLAGGVGWEGDVREKEERIPDGKTTHIVILCAVPITLSTVSISSSFKPHLKSSNRDNRKSVFAFCLTTEIHNV